MRNLGMTLQAIGNVFGVDEQTVRNVLRMVHSGLLLAESMKPRGGLPWLVPRTALSAALPSVAIGPRAGPARARAGRSVVRSCRALDPRKGTDARVAPFLVGVDDSVGLSALAAPKLGVKGIS